MPLDIHYFDDCYLDEKGEKIDSWKPEVYYLDQELTFEAILKKLSGLPKEEIETITLGRILLLGVYGIYDTNHLNGNDAVMHEILPINLASFEKLDPSVFPFLNALVALSIIQSFDGLNIKVPGITFPANKKKRKVFSIEDLIEEHFEINRSETSWFMKTQQIIEILEEEGWASDAISEKGKTMIVAEILTNNHRLMKIRTERRGLKGRGWLGIRPK